MPTSSADPFADRFARHVHGMRSSAMRDLMAITQRPEVISLAGGLPDLSEFDTTLLAEVLGDLAQSSTAQALQYGPTEGLDSLRELIVGFLAEHGIASAEERVLVTTGGQQVLDLFARILIDPGDVILAEGPTYPGAVPVFNACQAEVRHLPLDGEGLDPDLLVEALDELAREGRRAKYLYVIPTFQNPAGTTMPLDRRERLVQIAAERDLLVLEDDPYSLLRFDGDPVPSLRSLDPDGTTVCYLGTFSKMFAPGVRVGWLEAPPSIIARANLVKQAADLCTSPLAQLLVQRFFTGDLWRRWVDESCARYRERRDALVGALAAHFPEGSTWTTPDGGLFVWATVPAGVHTGDLLARALQENVAFVPGASAFLDGSGTNSMRLNFSAATAPTISEGIARIGRAIDGTLSLARKLQEAVDAQPEVPR